MHVVTRALRAKGLHPNAAAGVLRHMADVRRNARNHAVTRLYAAHDASGESAARKRARTE